MAAERALPHEAARASRKGADKGLVSAVLATMGFEVEALSEQLAAAGVGAAVLRFAANGRVDGQRALDGPRVGGFYWSVCVHRICFVATRGEGTWGGDGGKDRW